MAKKILNLDTQLKDIEVESSEVLSEQDKKILEEDQKMINNIINNIDKMSVDELNKELEKYVNFGLEDLDDDYFDFMDETEEIVGIVKDFMKEEDTALGAI